MKILLWLILGLGICLGNESNGYTSYVLGNTKHTIIPKSQEFIQTLSTEVFDKTKVRIYVDVIDEFSIPSLYPTKESRREYQQKVLQSLSSPCVVVFLFLQEHKIEIISTQDLQSFLDSKKLDSIYFDYMAPLLPEKETELTPQRISAVILNGYSEIADKIASHYDVKLENNFETDERDVQTITRFIIYIMLFVLVGLFVLAYVSPKKGKK